VFIYILFSFIVAPSFFKKNLRKNHHLLYSGHLEWFHTYLYVSIRIRWPNRTTTFLFLFFTVRGVNIEVETSELEKEKQKQKNSAEGKFTGLASSPSFQAPAIVVNRQSPSEFKLIVPERASVFVTIKVWVIDGRPHTHFVYKIVHEGEEWNLTLIPADSTTPTDYMCVGGDELLHKKVKLFLQVYKEIKDIPPFDY